MDIRPPPVNVRLKELLRNIPNPAPRFVRWLHAMAGSGKLERLLQAAKKAGMSTETEALLYFNELIVHKNILNPASNITRTDIKGIMPKRPFQLLREALGENFEQDPEINLYLLHGIIGHNAIRSLLLGWIPDREVLQRFLETTVEPTQTILFPAASPTFRQENLFADNKTQNSTAFLDEITPNNRISDWLREKIECLAKEIRLALQQFKWPDDWLRRYDELKLLLREFSAVLNPIFAPYIRRLRGNDPLSEYLLLCTLLSWATVLPQALDQPRQILYPEIQILAPERGLSGGRLDALRITPLVPPPRWHQRFLEWTTRQRFSSVEDLLRRLERKFGTALERNFQVEPLELKFGIGDAPDKKSIITAEEVTQPITVHAEQVRWYVALTTLGKSPGQKPTWKKQETGELMYILPSAVVPPKHQIIMSPDELKETFDRKLAVPWCNAQERALVRADTYLVVWDLVEKLQGRRRKIVCIPSAKKEAPSLFPKTEPRTIGEMLARHRKFADPQEIIELRGHNRDGAPRYFLHFDKFLEALRRGELTLSRGFSLERGGAILCLLHPEKTPSLHIYVRNGSFHCFGCGAHGKFEPTSIPPDFPLDINAIENFPCRIKPTQIVIPDEHHKIMSAAQESLHNRFRNSKGETYLARERCLDPDLAHTFGAGFGTNQLILDLLDAGHTWEELLHYGFVYFSGYREQDLYVLLRKRGMPDSIITQTEGNDLKFPHNALDGRLTFPLSFGGRATNLYGRYVFPCDPFLNHRKLTIANTNIPAGGFNMMALSGEEAEIVVTEAILDALSLIQLGEKAVIALIGTSYTLLTELVALNGKAIALALDNDSAGWSSADKLEKKFNSSGVRVRNFTTEFLQKNPEAQNFKDWNAYWCHLTKTKH